MSKARRRAKAANRKPNPPSRSGLIQAMYEQHRVKVPTCTFGDQPHYVSPSVGQIGFYMCDIPDDIRNHTRCVAPFDHEHEAHFDLGSGIALLPW